MKRLWILIATLSAALLFASSSYADISTPLVPPDEGASEYSIPPPSSYGKREFDYGDKIETYYWDGEDLVMVGGGLDPATGLGGVRFTGGQQKSIDGRFDMQDFSGYHDEEMCTFVPDDKAESIKLNVQDDGSLQLDLQGDGTDGGNQGQGSGEIKWGKSVGTGSIIGISTSSMCEYKLYEHFNYRVEKINILGKQGVRYEDWVPQQNRKNIYRAYRAQLLNEAVGFCASAENKRQDDKNGCLIAIVNSFDRCYKEAGLGGKNVEEADVDVNLLVTCMKLDTSLLMYFDSEDAIEQFIRGVILSTQIPEDVRPKLNDPPDRENPTEGKTTCSIEKIGWILCPTFTFVSKITDQLFKILRNWFEIRPFEQRVNGQDTPPYQVWSRMLALANIIFVVAFMIMVYSMITGGGLSAYNIRKLLPRMIVTAILVNASFYISAIAVDLSNIVGDSIYGLFTSMSSTEDISDSIINSGDSNFGTWESITTNVVLAGGAMAGTVAIAGNLAALAPVMLFALFAMLITWVVLLLRQAVIIMLVVISPIAFAMFLLPNTKKWFDRWQKLFVELLVLYPMIALVFGGSYFASVIIRETGAQQGDILLTIFALGIQVIPLFITPLMIKFGGHLLNRFTGFINDKGKGGFDRAMGRANELKDDQKLKQQTRAANGSNGAFGIYGGIQRSGMRAAHKRAYRKAQLDKAQALDAARHGKSIARGAGGYFGGNKDAKQFIEDQLANQVKSLEGKQLSGALVRLDQVFLSNDALAELGVGYNDALEEMAQNGTYGGKAVSETDRAAAIQKLAGQGDLSQIHSLINKANNKTGSLTNLEREALVKGISQSGISSSAAHLGGSALESIRTGEVNGVDQLYQKAIQTGKYSENAIASQSAQSIAGLAAAKASGAVTGSDVNEVKAAYARVEASDTLKTKVTSSARDAWRSL
ncbi:hypothetical protein I8H83_05625 [Candidatus Saccharibacteria bacterium]|nr:hypothetical protein [Candidatus Saccharibacteria bacterium]